MSNHTGKTYTFSNFQELIDKVPADRIAVCLNELGTVLSSAKAAAEVAQMIATQTVEPSIPAMILPAMLEWHDDGKEELIAHMHTSDGAHLFDVDVSQKTA